MGRDMMRLRRGILLNTPHEEQASGAVASFATDISKLKECVVGIEPVQDLHGYDSPWPPGGGKNLLELYLARTSYNGIDFSLTTDGKIHAQGTNSSGSASYSGGNYSTYDNCPWHFPAGTYTISCTVPRSNTDIGTVSFMLRRQSDNGQQTYNQLKNGSSTFTIDEPFGAWFWFSVLNGKTVDIDVGLQLEKGSTATSWTPYSNICPISGWSEAKVYDDPKYDRTVWWNQAFLPASDWIAHSVQTRFSVSDGVITATLVSGTPSVYAPAIAIEGGTVVTSIANHKYYFACKFNPAADGYPYLRNNTAFGTVAVFGTKTTRAGEWGSYENIVRAPATGGPAWYLGNGGNTSKIQIGDSFSIKDLMCIDLTAMFGEGNEPSTIDEFKDLFPNDYYAYNAGEETLVSAVNGEPYRAVTIDLDGTRYGGTLDVLSGVLTVDKGFVEYDGSNDETWYLYDPDNYDSLCFNTPTIVNKKIGNSLSICNRFANVVSAWGAGGNGKYGVFSDHTTLARFYFRQPNANVSTIPQWKAWLSENPVTVVYPLATPTTVQLTPAQLRAIQGQNNIFSDCGDVAVKYWKH